MEVDRVLLAFGGGEPVEVVDQGGALRLVGLVFVQDDPAVAADRGAVVAGGVDDGKLARRASDEDICRRRRAGRARDDEVAIAVLERGLLHLGLEDVSELHVADRAGRLRDPGGDAGVPLGTIAGRPGDRFAGSPGLGLPIGADAAEVVGENIGRAAAVRAVDDMDVLVRQADTTIVGRHRRVIPLLDFAQEDAGNGGRRELELAVRHAVQVVGERLGTKRARDLDDLIAAAHGVGFFRRQWDVAGAKVHNLLRQLLDAGARATATIVDRDLAELPVVGKVGGVIERLGKRGARTSERGPRRRWYSSAPC